MKAQNTGTKAQIKTKNTKHRTQNTKAGTQVLSIKF